MLHAQTDMYMYRYIKAKTFTGTCTCKLNMDSEEWAKHVIEICMILLFYFKSPGQVTCRVADELPWLLKIDGDKESLQKCILNLCIFQRLYAR